MRALPLLLLPWLLGCSERPPPPTAPFVAGTASEAARRVESFLAAYRDGDVERALSHLCERDPDTRAFLERSLAPGSPFRIGGYEIVDASPLWQRREPLHLVTVRIPRRVGAPMEHGYRVRAADGCIERLFDSPTTPPSSQPPDTDGRGDDGDVEERGDEGGSDERWGPPLPAAPVAADDEILDL